MAALALVAAACSKTGTDAGEDLGTVPEVPEVVVTYIQADGNEDSTKGSVSNTDATFTWNTGDRIAVWADGYKISDALESSFDGQPTATFAFSGSQAVTEGERAHFAIYPASLVWDGASVRPGSASDYTAAGLKLTLPASYTLAEVQDEVSPTPMIATNTPGGVLAFKVLCPLLRVIVANVPKQTKRLEFDFDGRKVQGEFTLTGVTPATSAIETVSTTGSDDIVTVTLEDNASWQNSLTVNLSVPTGSYGNVTITAYDAVSGGNKVLSLTKPVKASGWNPTRKASRRITAELPFFTGAGGRKLAFAPGNLQAAYDGSSWSWAFAAHPYDFIGKNPGNTKVKSLSPYISENATVDLFGWVGASSDWTDVNAYGITSSNSDYGSVANEALKHEWGGLAIGTYPAGTWRTPLGNQQGDWYQLLSLRTTATVGLPEGTGSTAARYVLATVAGVKGLILFPDSYSHPGDVSGTFSTPVYNAAGDYAKFVVDAGNWAKMEAAGAVFLPAAGYREQASVGGVGSYGYYWSATGASTSNAYDLRFSESTVSPSSGDNRYRGQSVRLVRELD